MGKVEGKLYCDISKLSVRPITKSVAKDIIINNHYSGLWTKVSYALGLFYISDDEHNFFSGVNEQLIGVACYGDPIGRSAGQSITPSLERTEVLELTRLFVFDGYGSNIESWFLSQTFDWLRENAPHIKALISYSDPKVGHNGTIYQATNWLYQGNKLRYNDSWSFKWNEDDVWHHSRTSYVKYGTNDPKIIQTMVTSPFWIKKEPRKHRYVYILVSSKERKKLLKELKHPTIPYPKTSEDFMEEIYQLNPVTNES
jgi:hypothetical protein